MGADRGGAPQGSWTLLLALALALSSSRAVAEPPPPTENASEVSSYEAETVNDALRALGEVRDPSPEGKRIEGIDVVTLEVIEERDPAPRLLNILHATTRPSVVEREILVRRGEPYRQVLVDESVRNLRKLSALSLVLAVPLIRKGDQGQASVRLLVITKDVWSLRANWNAQVSSGGLEELTVEPSETNLLGSHQRVSASFDLLPNSATFGGSYSIPRLAGSRIQVASEIGVVTNRRDGSVEGSYGLVFSTLPLFSALNTWAWSSETGWDDRVLRHYVNARLAAFDGASAAPPGTPAAATRIPWEYRARHVLLQESVTRSFGWGSKHDFSLGAAVDLREYRVGAASDPAYDPAAVSLFTAKQVPRSDDRLGPFVQYHAYSTSFLRVHDVETLGLQEDFALGHNVYVRLYPVMRALGSSRDVLGLYAAASYTVAMGDGIARGYLETITEAETERLSDASINAGLRLVSPRFPLGRMVFDAQLYDRYRNYLNRTEVLGGNTNLRGYPTNFFVGKDLITSNLEFRTKPVEVLSCELGAAAFYDVGDAFDGFASLDPKQSVGAGLRILFPQLDRLVFRGDIGFPVGAGAQLPGVSPVSFFIAFDQAFVFPSLTTAQLPTGP